MVFKFNPFTHKLDFTGNSGGGGTVTSVTGTLNRITSTGGTTPQIDIAATYIGQTSLTTLGTITTGLWNGNTIGPTFGGTGQNTYATGDIVYASAANILSKLPFTSNGQVLTLAAGIPSWATPTTSVGTISGDSGSITGSSVTIFADQATKNSGYSVSFTNSGTVSTLNLTDSNSNTFLGNNCGGATNVFATGNTALGTDALSSIGGSFTTQTIAIGKGALASTPSSGTNIAIGVDCMGSVAVVINNNVSIGNSSLKFNDGAANVCLGNFTGFGGLTMNRNILLGDGAGINYTSNESDNILLGRNIGIAGEQGAIRIGDPINQTTNFQAGINGNTLSGIPLSVVIDPVSHQLGVVPGGTILSYTAVDAAMSPYTVLSTDQYISIDTSVGSVTLNFPVGATVGQSFIVKDRSGNSSIKNITITTLIGIVTFDGSVAYTINTNFGSIQIMFNGSNYELF